MGRVHSCDGTPIAYELMGIGPAVILVGGGLDDGSENAPLASELAERLTVYNYARRGRGESGDIPPYAVAREIEDIEALIGEAGGSAHLYGVSSGGALALEAAAAGLAVGRVAVYEVPYGVGNDAARRHRRYLEQLAALLADGRRADALELFMRVAGSSKEGIEEARRSPVWPSLEALAHTLAYDAACLGDGLPPTDRLAQISQPILVLTGGTDDFFERAADALAAALRWGERQTLQGQSHVADPSVVAPLLARFFGATS
jgi:pimeloyl-ACP methyl ester carboxylesterase